MRFEDESNDDRINELRQMAERMLDCGHDREDWSVARQAPRSDEFDIILPHLALSLHLRRNRT